MMELSSTQKTMRRIFWLDCLHLFEVDERAPKNRLREETKTEMTEREEPWSRRSENSQNTELRPKPGLLGVL
jgi:hypothetical protein